MLITTTQPQQQQQQKLNNHTVITTTTTSENSSQVFAALGMELVKASPTNVAQTVQKLPQVSLLQNPSKKSLKKSEIINDVSTTTSVMTVLKNSQEIKVANLSSEVSLIKKSNNSSSKETSLLKNSNKISDLDKSTITTTNAKTKNNNNNNNNNNKEQSIMKKDTNESYSLLKSNNDLKKSLEDEYNPNKPEKQTSLLKPINKSPQSSLGGNQTNATTTQLTSPRSQRSNSCTTNLKSSSSSSSNSASANNERRHSEPAKIELVKNIKNLEKSEESSQDIESLKSQELDIYFEDEEYLESSGDKLSINSEKSQDNDNNCPASAIEKEIKEIIEETKMKSNNKLKEDETLEFVTEMEEEKTKQVPQETESFETLMKEIKTNLEIEEKTKKVPQETDSFQTLMKEIQKTISSNENNNEVNENRNLTEDDGEEGKEDDDDDDDVTILPMEEMEIEQIEIDDDDDDDDVDGVNTENNNLRHSSPDNKEQFNESLLCDEQILISSSSSISNNSSDQNSISLIKSPKNDNISNVNATKTTTTTPLLKKTLMEPKVLTTKDESQINGYSSVLDMLSNFNMLNWRERIGTARGTNLKFQLNEFNLIQLYEKSTPNKRIHTAYEKPIYERESSHRRNENGEPPIYYMCRRCNVQGPAVDFLAPEFCSLSCLKRDCRKRRDDAGSLMRKRNRLNNNSSSSNANKYYTNNSNNSNNCNSITSNINNDTNNINNPPPLSYIKKPKFRWTSYMNSNFSTMAAPISLFLNPFPTGPNNFMVGMKLEAIDPENCALFCVCTIIDIMGYRLKLSFDGYDSAYDFWLNADSMDIFPPGWCAKTNRILQPPKGISANKFNWGSYLNRERAVAAPRHLFTHLNSSSLVPRNPFKIGMHLEAEDLNDTGKLCVASVADVLDDRIRIHFDGWDDCYDIIVDINSPYIHPCGWHEGRQQLVVPPDCENTAFNWNDYIRKQGTGEAANEELFAPREPISFKPNMRLEVVDPRNPSLIRPATVVTHKGHRVKLHLDGWPSDYCFWLEDDSPDLHPIGWCDATGHDLEPPPGYQMTKQKMPCPVEGCRGIGNAKKAFMGVHATREGCPYAPENWRLVVEKPQRVEYENIVRTLPKQHKQIVTHPITASSLQAGLSEQQILERIQMLDNIKTRNVVVQQDKLPSNHSDLLCGLSSLAQIKKEEIKYSKIIPPNTTTTTSTSPTSSSADNVLDVNLDIAREFLYDYGPRLQQNYALWQNNFTFDVDKIKRNPLQWSTTEVSVFVDIYLKCRKTATKFSNEDIDGQAFLLLQQQDLTEKLGLKLGPAVKLYTCILQLRTLAVTKFEVPYKRIVNKK
ncbi:lethal (3) malignant brain tumor isoform 2-T4 [Cochliomyia hominivorax]